jgi:hypothetical protein
MAMNRKDSNAPLIQRKPLVKEAISALEDWFI